MNQLTLGLLLPFALSAPPAPVGPGCPPAVPCPPTAGVYGVASLKPPQQPCPPLGPPAPLLAGRVIAPLGSRVTVLPGGAAARTFDTPVVVGFRPGFAYRLELTNLPGYPGLALYPTLEVRGSLVPRAGMEYLDFPAPVYVSQGDVEKVVRGGLVTKVVYLEDPTVAVPVQSRPDQPIEFGEVDEAEALRLALASGRPVAILRLGDRKPDAEELARFVVAGTVLFPGEKHLTAPAHPPYLGHYGVSLYDPAIGPKPPTEECLTDGGDVGPRIGVGPAGRVGGLNPTDVAAEYTVEGKRRVTTSNTVCVCSPRYVIRRADALPGALQVTTNPDAAVAVVSRAVTRSAVPPLAVANRVKPVGFVTRLRPALMVERDGIHTFVGLVRPQGVATIAGLKSVVTVVEVDEITSYPNELTVTKSVDPAGSVKPGAVVTFSLRYTNGTRSPATDLMLSDSLSGRLEYVVGSAKSDRPTNVTTVENEAGSVIVRFEIPGPVPAGQSGVVTFQARVR